MSIGETYRRDRTSAADQVANDIRGEILARRLARGARLPSERELAARYEVSPPTIREAIRALSASHLVEARHGSGTFVTADAESLMTSALDAVVQLEDIDLANVMELSEGFYLQAVRLAISEAVDADLVRLRDAADALAGDLDAAGSAAALHEFLLSLVSASHNRLLIVLSGFLIEAQVRLASRAAERSSGAWKRIAGALVAERLAIVDALDARDGDTARAAVLVYMQRGHTLVEEQARSD